MQRLKKHPMEWKRDIQKMKIVKQVGERMGGEDKR